MKKIIITLFIALFIPISSYPVIGYNQKEPLPSLAHELIDNSSLFDLFKYTITIQNEYEREQVLDRLIELFITEIDPNEALSYWQSLSEALKKRCRLLFTEAIQALINEKTLFQQKNGSNSSSFTAAIPPWEEYRTLTKKMKNRVSSTSQSKNGSIDVARMLSKELTNTNSIYSITEVALDILAVDIMRKKSLSTEKSFVDITNELLFTELRIRFPPNIESSRQIDQFSNIHEIMLSKRGVCLGVSNMYLALLQRMGLSFSIYTPPGHIFISTEEEHNGEKYERVIETTARGIHIPLKKYLDSRAAFLVKRDLHEVIGLTLMNNAAKELQENRFQSAIELYQRAKKYIIRDTTALSTFLSFALLANGQKKEAQKEAYTAYLEGEKSSYEGNALAFDIAHHRLEGEALSLLIEITAIQDEKEYKKKDIREKLKKYLIKTPVQERSFSLSYLFAELSLLFGKKKEAFDALKTSYKEWISKGRGDYMGIPQLLLLSAMSLEDSDIRNGLLYAKEAFYLVEKKRKIVDKRQEVSFPEELQELLLALTYKSPGALAVDAEDEKILF